MTTAEHPTRTDPDTELERLLAHARELRPVLLTEQDATEKLSRYSPELHERFLAAGFYRMLQPPRYGGLGLGVSAFYRVIAEVARGCPSTAWCLCLGAEHSLHVASFFTAPAQQEIFDGHGYCISPASGNGYRIRVAAEPGGYRISGKWGYCSGAPYSTHFMGFITLPPDVRPPGSRPGLYWFVVPKDAYTVLDDWSGVIGLRGSGSNSVVLDNTFVPHHMITSIEEMRASDGDTPGSRLHGDALYGGTFTGFSEGDIAAIAVGIALAAVDEYARLMLKRSSSGRRRGDEPDYQRWLGQALAQADAAMAITVHGGQRYEEYARDSVAGRAPFSYERSVRLRNMYFTAQGLAAEVVDLLLRMAGSGATMDGQRMQRYFRDMLAIRTRFDQLERVAPEAGRLFLGVGQD